MLSPLLGLVALPLGSRTGWSEDLTVLYRTLTNLHPGIYRYQTPQQFEARFQRLRQQLPEGTSRAEGFLRISEFLAYTRCGHTYTNFFNQPKEIQKELFEARNKVPFTFRWIQGRMVVLDSVRPQCDLPRGTVVERLNGVDTARILKRLMAVARADGSSDGKRRRYLEINGQDGFEAFDIYYPLYYPSAKEHFDLLVRRPASSRSETVRVGALDLKQRQQNQQKEPADAARWTEKQLTPEVTYVNMTGWAFYNSKWDWQAALEQMFTRLNREQVPNLILDIRENEGGVDVGDEIAAHLIDQPLPTYGFDRYVSYRRVPSYLNGYLSTWDNSFRNWGANAREKTPLGYRLLREVDQESTQILPKGTRYRGKVIVLIGATNSSATFQFASLVKRGKLGTLVGQPSGGNRRGINGGCFFFLGLPNSKIEVDIPLIRYQAKTSEPDSGIRPDVLVPESIEAIASGKDPELAAALRLIGKKP